MNDLVIPIRVVWIICGAIGLIGHRPGLVTIALIAFLVNASTGWVQHRVRLRGAK